MLSVSGEAKVEGDLAGRISLTSLFKQAGGIRISAGIEGPLCLFQCARGLTACEERENSDCGYLEQHLRSSVKKPDSHLQRRSFLSASLAYSFQKALGAAPGPHRGFTEIARKSGVLFRHEAGRTQQKYLPEAMGGGVAMFDYNQDGRLDLFFVNGAALRDPMRPEDRPDKSDPKFWNRVGSPGTELEFAL